MATIGWFRRRPPVLPWNAAPPKDEKIPVLTHQPVALPSGADAAMPTMGALRALGWLERSPKEAASPNGITLPLDVAAQ